MSDISNRQLAAIMFTDMAGYTALMQEDEQQAKANRDRHRQVLNKSIDEHQGKILQYYGDGTLTIFNSAIEAVKCGVRIQGSLQEDPIIPLRIGIHSGDIVYDDEGVYGDSVNVASRIENLAVSGSVLISEKVKEEIKNHRDLETHSLGKFELKNVKKIMDVFAIKNDGMIVPSLKSIEEGDGATEKSIAVLPFVNMSTDPENEYFSDGITEEILNALTKVNGLLVTARTSSFAFKGKNKDIRKIAAQLNVNYILEGSVRKAGNKIRITTQLISTADGYHMWSDVFDRQLEDVFEVQDEISKKIANKLREHLTDVHCQECLVDQTTANIDAYNLYLKGLFFWNKFDPESMQKAIKLFEQSIDIEPDYASPYSYMANCYTFLAATGLSNPDEAYAKAEEFASKAMELDCNLAESQVALALVKLFHDLDFEQAGHLFKNAKEVKPDCSDINNAYGIYLLLSGQSENGIEELEMAVKLDPLSLITNNHLATGYFYARRYEDALAAYDRTLDLDGNFRNAIEGKGWVYIKMGQMDKAFPVFENLYKLTADPLLGFTGLAYAHGITGNSKEANKFLKMLEERDKRDKDTVLHVDFAILYAGLGNKDKVFFYLDKAFDANVGALFFNNHPMWEEYYKDERFKKLWKKYVE